MYETAYPESSVSPCCFEWATFCQTRSLKVAVICSPGYNETVVFIIPQQQEPQAL